MILYLVSAEGFHCDPSGVARVVEELPGFEPRSVKVEGGRQVSAKHLGRDIVSCLSGRPDRGGLTITGPDRAQFVNISTNRVFPEFDVISAYWDCARPEALLAWLRRACPVVRAELGVVLYPPEQERFDHIGIISSLHNRLPGIGSLNWYGPQLKRACPVLLRAPCWESLEAVGEGALAIAASRPPLSAERTEEIRRCIGEEFFIGAKFGYFSIDVTEKDPIIPAWFKRTADGRLVLDQEAPAPLSDTAVVVDLGKPTKH